MQVKIDQKVWSAIGIAAAGALGALAAADIDPRVTAFAAVAVIILGSLGVHVTQVPEARKERIIAASDAARAGAEPSPPQAPTTADLLPRGQELPPRQEPPPPEAGPGTTGRRHGLP